MRHSNEDEDEDLSTSADAPLIAPTQTPVNTNKHAPAITFSSTSPIIRYLTLSAGISGLLFGFDTGVISSTLVSIGTDLSNRPLTTPDKALVTAITSLFALLSAPTTGFFADKYGRRSVIFVPAVLFIVGAVVQALAHYVWTMAAGRALVGVAVGVASGAVPLYITELAPAELRGRLVTVQALFITGGQVVAYLIGWIFASWPGGWRWMVGLGAVPAVVQLGLLVAMPETPRFLVQNGEEKRAKEVLTKVFAGLEGDQMEDAVRGVLEAVRAEIEAEGMANGKGSMAKAKELVGVPGNRRALIIACMLQGLQQLSGFNSLMYFSATIFALVGFTSPIFTSLSIAITNFIFTLVAFTTIDTVGRRAILLRSIPFMILGLLSCSLAFMFIDTSDIKPPPSTANTAWPYVLLVSLVLYVAAYAVGLGCVPWQQSELFPLRVRSLGSGVATATNWSSNFVIGLTFLPLMKWAGPSVTFVLYAAICCAGWMTIWRIYPETAGLELEDIGELLKSGWGVGKSVAEFRKRRSRSMEDERNESEDGQR
ncbi:uncharacterized protein MYCGRDRAFT_77545 [Zymoseptoria tritici IPO323]|uniref:Major facilitator superfamily (MFS) profile domain-containing protein n=1 Tax=Zymoseptoria tritici (strain CBS 115943 / IPO323) TaxID=336722 RepID=F9XP18_ZYMTI|nr:uncharacterized protein MYCGRDRAFT_77545 [Zymoseptoria tritici IPO323]EGP83071.1 hypothetical protein MYCGRDRAFT_77545 [Zymoseptoria tritici IPO323]